MKNPPAPERDTSGDVPAYIVTFSDMVTLLLTFFVMLLSMAEVQDPELFNKGRDSFVESLQHCGLGMLLTGSRSLELQHQKERHKTPENDPNSRRTIDAQREQRRRAFERLSESMTTMPSQLVGQVDYTVLPVRFADGRAELPSSAAEMVWQFAQNLPPRPRNQKGTLYVLGLSVPTQSLRTQWTLSAKRAEAIATLVREALPDAQWNVLSWGAGSGHGWTGSMGDVADHAHVVVGVLRDGP
ncbi:flagellar motor protein MotB [Planctomycetota bacterium]